MLNFLFIFFICFYSNSLLASDYDCGDKLDHYESISGSIKLELIKHNWPKINSGIYRITNKSNDKITIFAFSVKQSDIPENVSNDYKYNIGLYRLRMHLNRQTDGWLSLSSTNPMGASWGSEDVLLEIDIGANQYQDFIGPFISGAVGNSKFAYRFYLITPDAFLLMSSPYCFSNAK